MQRQEEIKLFHYLNKKDVSALFVYVTRVIASVYHLNQCAVF